MGQGQWSEERTGRARLRQAERGKYNKTKERERTARQEEGERKGKHNYLIVQYLILYIIYCLLKFNHVELVDTVATT